MYFMGVEDIVDGGENGVGMMVNGIELFGFERGDIDVLFVGCMFQYMNVGVCICVCNVMFQGDMFSYCWIGVIIDGIDLVYYIDLVVVNQNRGNIVVVSWFYNVGVIIFDVGIFIIDIVKVLYVIVEDNFFDFWLMNYVCVVGIVFVLYEGIIF